MGTGSTARERRAVWQWRFKREKRDNLTLNRQIERAERIADGTKPTRKTGSSPSTAATPA